MAEIIVDIGNNLVETVGCDFKGVLVRCKECRHWCKGDEVYGICYRCPNTRQMRYDDFCSYGEREGE